jgi:hypothetical protein
MARRCRHQWRYSHGVLDRRKRVPFTVVVVRYCADCQRREVSRTQIWTKARGDHALPFHYGPSFPIVELAG